MHSFRIHMALLLLALAAQLAAAPATAADAGTCSWDSVRNIGALLRSNREGPGKAVAAGARASNVAGVAAVTRPKLLDERVEKALARFERPVAETALPAKTPSRLKASEAYQELHRELGELRASTVGESLARPVKAGREPAAKSSEAVLKDPQVIRGPPIEKLEQGQIVDVPPARLITSQPDVGMALLGRYLGDYVGGPALEAVVKRFKVADPANPAHRKAYFEAVAGALRKMGEAPRSGFIGPDLNNPGRRVVMIEDATHRSTQSHMLTSPAEWKNLPPTMRNWLEPADLQALGLRSDTQLKVKVEKIYGSAEEMAFDFARSGRGLLPEALETGTSFEARAFREAREAARRAGNLGELAKVEREALVEGYRQATKEIGAIGDDPVRSAVGRLFDNYKGLSDNGKNYIEFDAGRALSEPQLRERIRALEITNDNFDSVVVQEALAHYLFDDPRVVRDFLRPLARPDREKEFNAVLDKIVSKRIADGSAEKAGARIAAAEAEASRRMAYHEKEARRFEQGLQKLRAMEAAGKAPEGSLQRKMLTQQSRQLEAAMREVNRARDTLAAAASFRNVNDPSVITRGPQATALIKDVDRLPANVKVTQSGYGKAQVMGTLEWRAAAAVEMGRTPVERLSHFADDLFKLSERELPAVRGPPLKGSGRPVIYITDGHHSGMQLYMLAHGRFDALPPGVQKLFKDANVSFDDWQRLHRHRLLINPRIEKTYLTADELVADWVRTGRGLLSGDVEERLSGELSRARQALKLEPSEVAGLGPDDLRRLELEKLRAVDPGEMRRLVDAYASLPDGFRSIKDDPVRSAVGEAFLKLGLGSEMVDYSQFRVYRDSPAFRARVDELVSEANRRHNGLNNLLLRPSNDPERIAFLSSINRALLDPSTDTPSVLARMAKPAREAEAANLAKLLKAQKEYHPQLRETGRLASAMDRASSVGGSLASPGMAPPVARFPHTRATVPGLPTLADLGPDRRVSEVVAEQARLLTKRREQAYRQMLKADPGSLEIRTFDTIIVGGGPQGVTAATNLKGTRTLMLNAGDRAGTFADFGDTFVVNSNETFGQASTNIIHGAPANTQVRNLAQVTPDAGDVYVTGRTIGDATDLNLALTEAEVLTKTRAEGPVWDKKLGLWKVNTPEGPFYAKNVMSGTGLGEEKFPFSDEVSKGIVKAEKDAGTHRVEFINHFMKRMQVAAEEGVNPLAKLPGKSYVVVGGGDGGAIVAKYLTGLGPPEGYGGRAISAGEGQKKVFWFGQKNADRAAYEQSTWGPYLDLGPKFDTKEVEPVNAHIKKVERTTGAEAQEGAFRFYYGDGPNDYKVADGLVSAAGYDPSFARGFWNKVGPSGSKVETFLIEGTTNQGYIAKGVKVDGQVQKGLYEFGPGTGGLKTEGLPGGVNSPRIETLSPRTQEVSLRIREEILADPKSKLSCLTCGAEPPVKLQPLARSSAYEAETTMKVKGRGFRVRDEGQREMMIKAHLADTMESLGLPPGRAVDLTLVPNPVRGELAIRSRSLERDDLGRLQAALQRNQLAELLLSQPSSKPNKALSVTLEASDSGAVKLSKADFLPPRRDPVVRLAADEVAIIGYGSLINKESMEKTLGRSLGEGKIFDVEVDGFRRTKNVRMRNESFYEELPNGARHYPEYISYYNVEPAKGERMTATMFVIKRSELDGFHQREWIYNPTDVGDRVLGARVVSNSMDGKAGEAYIYVGKQEHVFDTANPGDTRFRSTYADIVDGAVAKKNPDYQKGFRETTAPDSAPVIADKKDTSRRPMSDPVVPGSGAFVKYAMDEKTFVRLQTKKGYDIFPLKGNMNLGGSLFRGMSVNPEQFERILSKGLELEKAMGGRFISTSADASWAKLFQGRIGERSAERYVRVLFEVDPKSQVARKAGPDTAMGKSDIAFTGDIPPKDIRAIYILDPSKSVNPWTKFTVEQAQKLRFEADLAKARADGSIHILGRASSVGNSLADIPGVPGGPKSFREQRIEALSSRGNLTPAELDELAFHRRELAAEMNAIWPRTPAEVGRDAVPGPVARLRRLEELARTPESKLNAALREELAQLRRDHQADLNAIWPKTFEEAFPGSRSRASAVGDGLAASGAPMSAAERAAKMAEVRGRIEKLRTEYEDAKALWAAEQKKGKGFFYTRQEYKDAQARFEAAEKAYLDATEFSEMKRLAAEGSPAPYARAYAEAESVKTLPSAPRQARPIDILTTEQFDEKLAALFPGRPAGEVNRVLREAGLDNPHGSLSGAIEQHTAMGAEARWQPIDMINSKDPAKQRAGRLIQEIYDLHDKGDPAASQYFYELGRRHASRLDERRALGDSFARNEMPPPPAGVPGRYVDLATGIHTHTNFKYLDKNVTYQFNDLSPFVTGMNAGLAERFGLNAVSVQGNVMEMAAPAEKWAVLRSKNMIGYEPRFAGKLPEMTDWIQPGGKLVLQSDPGGQGFHNMASKHGPLLRRLMDQGWEASWDYKGKYYFDTIELTKPHGTVANVDQARVAADWEKLVSRDGTEPRTLQAARESLRDPALARASSVGRSLASAPPPSASEKRLARVQELGARKNLSAAERDELAFLRGEVAAEQNAVWPRTLADVHGRAATVEQQDTKLRSLGADLATTRDPNLTASLTRQAQELSQNLDAATEAARKRFEAALASGEPVGTLEAELALREAKQAQRVAKLATDMDANQEPLVRAYKQALVREADVKDPAARGAATRAIHELEAKIDQQAGRLRAHLDDLRARVAVTSEPSAAGIFAREAELAKARLTRLESAQEVFARPQEVLRASSSPRASNLGAALFQHDLKPPPFGRRVTEASRAEYYRSLPKQLVGDSAKRWKDTDELLAIGEKIRARARLGRLDPKTTHIPELSSQVESVLKGTRGAIEAQGKAGLAERIRGFFRGGSETKDERLGLMRSFEAEARARVANKQVTYEWWHDFNHRTEILKTEAHNRTAVRGGATSNFEKALLDSGGWKTDEGYRATARSMKERIGISEHDLTSHFPARILMPTRSGDINVVPMNEMFGTNINPLGQIDHKVVADGRVMYPDHFRGHDFVHAANENFIVGEQAARLSEFRRQYLAYRETLPIERRATFEIAYFIGTHEIPQIAESIMLQGKAADLWPRINNLEELVRSDQWLGNLVPASARRGEGTSAYIAQMTREMEEFGAAISPAMKEVLAREESVRTAERSLAEAIRKERSLRDPITGRATPLSTEERGAVNHLRELAEKRARLAEDLSYGRANYGKEYADYVQGQFDEASSRLRQAMADFEQKGYAHAGVKVEGDLAGDFRLLELGADGKSWVKLQEQGAPIASRQVAAGKAVAADALTEAKLADAVADVKKAKELNTRVLAMAADEKAADQARWLAIADGAPEPLAARASSVSESVASYRANYQKLEPSAKRVMDFATALRKREEGFAARELAAGSNKTSRELAREFARRGHVPEIADQVDGMLADAKAAIERHKPGFLSKLRGRVFGGGYEDRLKLLEQFRAEADARRAGGATYEWWQRFNERLDILKTPLAERSPELANRRSEFLARLLETDAWKTEAGYNRVAAERAFRDGSVRARNAAAVYPDVVLVPSRDGEVGIRALNELAGTNVHLVGKIGSTEYVDGFHMNSIGFSDHDIVHAANYKTLTGETAGYVTRKHFETVRDEYFRYRETLRGDARERFELAYHLASHENPAALARLTETNLDRAALVRQFEGGQVAKRLMDAGDLGKEYPHVRRAGPAAVAKFEREMMNDLLAFQERLRPRLTPLNGEYVAKNLDRLERELSVIDGLSTELERVRKGGVEKDILQARRELANYKADVESMFGMPLADLRKASEAGPPPAYVAQIPTEPVVGRAPASARASGVSGLLAEGVRAVQSSATRRLPPAVAQAREGLELARMQTLASARHAFLDNPSAANWARYRGAWDNYRAGVSAPDLAHRLAPDLTSAAEAARVQSALRQELEHLSLQGRLAERSLSTAVSAADKARYSGELAVLLGEKARASAQLAPEAVARGGAGNPIARFEQLRRNAYELHAAELGGLPYEQARRHPQLAQAISHLAARAAGEARLAAAATDEVARAAKWVFGPRADDRLTELAAFRRQGKAATPDDLLAAARARGWSPAEIEGCVKQGLCVSDRQVAARRAAAADASRADAPVSRELFASRASGERPVALSGAEVRSSADIRRDLATRRKLVDAEAEAVTARVAKEGPSAATDEALRAVRAAQDALQEHDARLAREASRVDSLLKRQRELGAGDSFVSAATGEITPTGRFAIANSKELEAAMKPAGGSGRQASRVMSFMKQDAATIERKVLAAGADARTARALRELSLDGFTGNPALRYEAFVKTVSGAGPEQGAKVLEAVAGKRLIAADALAKVSDELKPTPAQRLAASPGDLAAQRVLLEKKGLKTEDIELCKAAGACLHERTAAEAAATARAEASEAAVKAVAPEAKGRALASVADPVAARIEGFRHADPDVYGLLREAHEQAVRTKKPLEQSLEGALKRQLKKAELNAEERQGLKDLLACLNP